MSHDEIPSGSASPRPAEDDGASTPNDAPKGQRRRPARRSTTAPSQTETTAPAEPTDDQASANAPARAPRRRRTTAKAPDTEVEAASADAEVAPAPRRRRAAVKAAPEPESTQDVAAPTQAKPPARRSRAKVDKPAEQVDSAPSAVRQPSRQPKGTKGTRPTPTPAAQPVVVLPPAKPRRIRPQIDKAVGVHLVSSFGIPVIHINGSPIPPLLFFGGSPGDAPGEAVHREVEKAAAAGIHLHSCLIDLPCPVSQEAGTLAVAEQRVRTLLEADPQAYVIPRIVFSAAEDWRKNNRNEMAWTAEGLSSEPSIGSDAFWELAAEGLKALVHHLVACPIGDRVAGYHLEHAEWFQPADAGFDTSPAARNAFRNWLIHRYKGNLVSLRAAWYSGSVTFDSVDVPKPTPEPAPHAAFLDGRRQRSIIDYCEFVSECTASRLCDLAGAAKEACAWRALVSVCYGYTLEFSHAGSGHLALGKLLECEDIDLVCGPPSFRDRAPGGAASLPAPIDSIGLHGKLWLTEDDTKTWLATPGEPDDEYNERLPDETTTIRVRARSEGRALATGTAVGWMDLWGKGWLDSAGIWDRGGDFARLYSTFLGNRERTRVPQVAAVIDERSLLHLQRGEEFYRQFTSGLRQVLQTSGISMGLYLQSDILHPRFPDARLILFMTPFRLPEKIRAAVREKLQRRGHTIVWLYAPGSCEERPASGIATEEAAAGVVGMSLRQQEWGSETGSRVVNSGHLITSSMGEVEIGSRERLNPSWFVSDPDAVALAEYSATGLTSIAVKQHADWNSIFIGEPVLPAELWAGICRYAGVHLWMPGSRDQICAGNGWLSVHAAVGGMKQIELPTATGLYDLTEGRLIADETRSWQIEMQAGETRIFCVGSAEVLAKRGLPGYIPPGDTRSAIVTVSEPAPTPPPPAESQDTAPVSGGEPLWSTDPEMQEHLETLRAVLSADFDDYPEATPVEHGGDDADQEAHRTAPSRTKRQPHSSGRSLDARRSGRRHNTPHRSRAPEPAAEEPTPNEQPPPTIDFDLP
ncbi:MAG: hypothetical protein KGJ62_08395 [Armatimonadetes bacterium]|nr:hypothetical protein [Armatimonadota bacterium]MDE2205089.1 hypothetical protein [Armatimonadota bacterium]